MLNFITGGKIYRLIERWNASYHIVQNDSNSPCITFRTKVSFFYLEKLGALCVGMNLIQEIFKVIALFI